MVNLLDVNVLVALVSPGHVHGVVATTWLRERGAREGWATCPMTELGVIRVCAQAPDRMPPERTVSALRWLREEHGDRYVWWPDVWPPGRMAEVCLAETARQVPDRYLLGLARRYRARLVTFDRAIAGVGGVAALCLSPARSGSVAP